jgi:uncharacterized protein (TIGR00730 family)
MDKRRALLESPAYIRADRDSDFLHRDDLRATRLQLEYLKPELALQEAGITSTIVVFGGTRIVEPAEANRRLEAARRRLEEAPSGDPSALRAVRVAERIVEKSPFYGVAREFARIVSRWTREGGREGEFVIATGGGPGIMEAGNRGAEDSGAPSIGFNISLPAEQSPNAHITPELCFQFRYFALRKLHFIQRARALVAFPGGYGTLDELFTALCLVQTGKMKRIPIILVGRRFWESTIDLEFLADEGVIAPGDIDLVEFAETAEEIFAIIERSAGQGSPPSSSARSG